MSHGTHNLDIYISTHLDISSSCLHAGKYLNLFPYFSLTKPQSFADCVGDELPVGWEQVLDINRGVYYVNHVESK